MAVTAVSSSPRLEAANVLVVEDNPVERTIVERVLRDAGFAVCAVADASGIDDALRLVRPDLILLDAMLPDHDGFSVCQRLRASGELALVPIVMLTGLGDVASVDRAYKAGATDFITKPVGHSLLVHRLRYLLRAAEATVALRRSELSFARAERVAGLGHWELDVERDRLRMSSELCRLYGLEDRSGHLPWGALLEAVPPEDRPLLTFAVDQASQGREMTVEHRLHDDNGRDRVIELHVTRLADGSQPVSSAAGDGLARPPTGRRLMGIALDITERKQSEREVLRLAYFDRLTELPNRTLLESILEQEIPRAHLRGGRVALVTIDLDLFNRVNNAMGHTAGDALLRQVGQRLGRLVRGPAPEALLERLSQPSELQTDWPPALVARLGGDVFAVVVAGAEVCVERGMALAERMREVFQQPFIFQGQEVFITAGIGFACSDSATASPNALLQQADLALRMAKSEGQGEVREYHPVLVAQVSAQLAMQSDLRKALRRSEFQLHYQPKLGLASDQIDGAEALIRWYHPQRGIISPSQFIQLAEETGQIVDIGRWVLTAACHQYRQWLDQRLVRGRIAVNVSARQLRERHLMRTVLGALEQTGLAPEHLELEITEGVLMSDPRAIEMVAELRDHGIAIALDDFGTGFSSLSYLTRFPIDTVKIDRSFVSDITPDSDKAAIVAAVTGLSHRLQMTVVAEGVETEEELSVIRDLSCDQVQGFRLSHPRSGLQMEKWLQAWRDARPQLF